MHYFANKTFAYVKRGSQIFYLGGNHKPYGHGRGRGGLPNVNITTYALLSKMVHKEGRGSKKSKFLSTWFVNDPPQYRDLFLKV